MSDLDPMGAIFQAAATIRTGKGGPAAKAWAEALTDATLGMTLFLNNTAALEAHLQTVLAALTTPDSPIEAVPTLILPE